MSHPAAEVSADVSLVRSLLEAERPDLRAEPVRPVGQGWDNYTFRVGERHAVRLPRRKVAVELTLNEQRWLPVLASRLPLDVPEPISVHGPSRLFAWPWSVVRWVPGDTAEGHRFGPKDVTLLAETLRALHQPASDDAPINPVRGVPLGGRDEPVRERLARLRDHPGVDAARLSAIWRECLDAPAAEGRRWLHGDLHPRNVVVRGGGLAGLIDWGDLNGGDASTDLACAWTLIASDARRRDLLDAYAPTDAFVRRAMGWAVHMGLSLVDSGEPRHVPLGVATLERVLLDA